jgi:hypothetical protein
MWATEVAEAQLELLRIRGVRADLMAKVDLASGNLEELQRLASLDRDERSAHSKRRRASRNLNGDRRSHCFVRTNPVLLYRKHRGGALCRSDRRNGNKTSLTE